MKKVDQSARPVSPPLDEPSQRDEDGVRDGTDLWSQRAMLSRYLRKRVPEGEDADDFIQDAYVRLLAMNDEQRREIKDLPGFLVRTASNLLMDNFRKRRSRQKDMHTPLEEAHSSEDDWAFDGERMLRAKQELDWVTETLDTTDHEARRALYLVRVEGLSHAQAANELGVEKKRVARLIEIALYRLSRQKIAQELHFEEDKGE